MSSFQSACVLLRPFGWFQSYNAEPIATIESYQIASFRYDIPRPKIERKAKPVEKKRAVLKAKTPKATEKKVRSATYNKSPRKKAAPILSRSSAQRDFCDRVDSRLSSISAFDCTASLLSKTGYQSNKGEPILKAQFLNKNRKKPTGRILLLGGVHGDELSAVSLVFEWMKYLRSQSQSDYIWHVVPVMNPDGFFKQRPTRTNANGVDLNRNMPTRDWQGSALKYWRTSAKAAPRKFPGFRAGSEPETRWLVQEIKRFQPDMIITVHAPFNLIDYDAPSRSNAPRHFGHIKGALIGTYPGSLGNYAGVKRGIPVVTIELPSANVATSPKQVQKMWFDMLQWLAKVIPLENQRFKENRRLARAGMIQ